MVSVDFKWTFSGAGLTIGRMTADERDICRYLKGFPGQFVSLGEISRRAGGKRRYREDPAWAVPILEKLVERKIVESDSTGHYRLRRSADKKKPQRWLSPQVRAILERSSADKFDEVLRIEEDDEFLRE